MPANGSVAVWCVPAKQQKSGTPVGVEAHFNYWRISKSGNSKDFFETGIMIDDPSEIDQIKMYFPWTIKAPAVVDCSKYFARHPDIVRGIFNTVISVTAPAKGQPRCVVLDDASGNVFCRVHSFEEDAANKCIDAAELEILHHRKGGTFLTITSKALVEARRAAANPARAYFRLRLALNGASGGNPFVEVIPTPDRLFQPGFEEIEFIDFRLNEVRTLPDYVVTEMEGDQATGLRAQLKLVAFLTAVPVRSQLTVSNFASHKMRRLEHDIWTHYAAGIPRGMVVYHWKKGALDSVSDFSTFVKLQTRRSGWKILLAYLVIVFLVGLAGNLVATAIWGHYTRQQDPKPAHGNVLAPANQAPDSAPQVPKSSAAPVQKPE